MNHRIRQLSACFVFTSAGLCHAGGSVAFEDVDWLIRTQLTTHKWLAATLEFPETADAEIRFGNHFQHLGGARIGPYTFRAKVKGAVPPAVIDVTVCTDADFYDKAGKRVTKTIEKSAVRVEEKLTAVLVRDAQGDDAASVCSSN